MKRDLKREKVNIGFKGLAERKEEKLLNKKRKLEKQKVKEAEHQVMSKRSIKQLKNLQKGR